MRIKFKNFGILNGKDLCLYILGLFILDSIFHITGYFLGGSKLGRIGLLGLMLIISCTGIIRQKICKLNRNDIAVIVLSALLSVGFLRAVIWFYLSAVSPNNVLLSGFCKKVRNSVAVFYDYGICYFPICN